MAPPNAARTISHIVCVQHIITEIQRWLQMGHFESEQLQI